MNNKRHVSSFYHLGNSKGFRSSVPEMGMKTKYIFFTINHNITPRYKRHFGGNWRKSECLQFIKLFYAILLFFLGLIILAWLYRRMSLFLRDTEVFRDRVLLCLSCTSSSSTKSIIDR